MDFNYTSAKQYIEELNPILKTEGAKNLDTKKSQQYCEAFKVYFAEIAAKIKHSTSKTQSINMLKGVFTHNYLYSLQLKANFDIGGELTEIAYDFDNIDYPGYDYLITKIKNDQYSLLLSDKSKYKSNREV